MNYSNLKTKLTVCPHVQITEHGFVTKKYLDDTLENYVTEAPVDGNTYARVNKEWDVILTDKNYIYTGFSPYLFIDDDDLEGDHTSQDLLQVNELSERRIDISTSNIRFKEVNTDDSNCFWICSLLPIKSIQITNLGFPIAYEEQPRIKHYLQDEDRSILLYAYRTDRLIPNEWDFTINFN